MPKKKQETCKECGSEIGPLLIQVVFKDIDIDKECFCDSCHRKFTKEDNAMYEIGIGNISHKLCGYCSHGLFMMMASESWH